MPPPTIRRIRFSTKARPRTLGGGSFKPRGRAGQTAPLRARRRRHLNYRDSTPSHFSVPSLFQLGFKGDEDGWDQNGAVVDDGGRHRSPADGVRQRTVGGGGQA